MKIFLVGALAGLIAFTNVFLLIETSNAADARNYNAGRIIDDGVFANSDSMSVQEIQNFLNSKVPDCDTWGEEPSEFGGGTRAQWLASRGLSVPLTCLRDYYENPSTGENNYGKAIPAGGISAAQIIYNYSKQFNINPQAIIVTLQKENGLVTDEWPTPRQFSQAMGFGCPDNVAPGAPACNPDYGGFSAQIYQAARHFRGFMDNSPGWFIPFTTGNNFIQWSPNASCGGSTVYIENRATVALYSYTPYQPNQAAKDAQYGTGDGCSAYGNRNFYMYFTDWFGSTYSTVSVTTALRVHSNVASGYYSGMPTTVSFDMYNSSPNSINIGSMAVSVRDGAGGNHDFGLKPMVIPGHSWARYEATQVLPGEGTYTFNIVNYSNGAWREDYPASSNISNSRTFNAAFVAAPTVTSSLAVGGELRMGKTVPVNFTVKNNSSQQLNLGKMGVGIRGPHNENFDLGVEPIVLNAGQSYVFSKNFTPTLEGVHSSFIIATTNDGASWESLYPIVASGAITKRVDETVRPGLTITQSLGSSAADLREGKQTTLSFSIKNHGSSSLDIGSIGLSGRDPSGRNIDPGVIPVTLAADEERIVNFNFTPSVTGQHRFSLIATKDAGRTWYGGPPPESLSIQRAIQFNVGNGITISQDLQSSSATLRTGQPTTLSFRVKNHGSSNADIGSIGLSGRDSGNANIDPGVLPTILTPGEDRIISFSFTPSKTGVHRFSIIATKDAGRTWYGGPPPEVSTTVRAISPQSLPGVTVSGSLQLSNQTFRVGVANQLTFILKNHTSAEVEVGTVGLMGRDPNGINVDPGAGSVTLLANEERTINYTISPTKPGGYVFAIIGLKNGTWLSDYPPSETQDIRRSVSVQAIP